MPALTQYSKVTSNAIQIPQTSFVNRMSVHTGNRAFAPDTPNFLNIRQWATNVTSAITPVTTNIGKDVIFVVSQAIG